MMASPVSHEPSDTELARRIALLDLDAADPHRGWTEFSQLLSPPRLHTDLLGRWLGRHIDVDAMPQTSAAGRTHRLVATLTTIVNGVRLPLCHVVATLDLTQLPAWAGDALGRRGIPVERVMRRAGLVRDRVEARLVDPLPSDPDQVALVVTGTACLPSGGGPVATMVERYTGHVLGHRAGSAAGAAAVRAEPTARPDHCSRQSLDSRMDQIDAALLALLRMRRLLAVASAQRPGPAPAAYPIADQLLVAQLGALFGPRTGLALATAVTSGTRGRRISTEPARRAPTLPPTSGAGLAEPLRGQREHVL